MFTSLGHDYAVQITTDAPVLDDVLTECFHAVNRVLAEHLIATNYDTAVHDLGPLRAKLQADLAGFEPPT